MSIFSESVVSRFWAKVEVLSDESCWEWTDTLNSNGYGQLKIDGKIWSAHRYSYEINVGPIGDLCVLHRCDNPSCVNPEHLWLGTQIDNIVDMDIKGRRVTGTKGRLGYKVLTQNQADEICAKYETGNYTRDQLAAEYGAGQGTMSKVQHRRGPYK